MSLRPVTHDPKQCVWPGPADSPPPAFSMAASDSPQPGSEYFTTRNCTCYWFRSDVNAHTSDLIFRTPHWNICSDQADVFMGPKGQDVCSGSCRLSRFGLGMFGHLGEPSVPFGGGSGGGCVKRGGVPVALGPKKGQEWRGELIALRRIPSRSWARS